MFTGLIQSLGRLSRAGNSQLRVVCNDYEYDDGKQHPILADMALGDSIAVDGVCLTVEHVVPQGFIATASPETLAKTTLERLPEGSTVNLETSLRVGSKIGGHFVTGHVDGLGRFEHATKTTNAWELRFEVVDPWVTRYVVSKGSIAINGISLTIADCSESGDWLTIAVIPVTYSETNLHSLVPGQLVNLEGDILGKYVEKFMRTLEIEDPQKSESVSLEFLTEHGYY